MIQPETDFVVPIVFDVDLAEIVPKDKNFLQNALNKLLNDQVQINYKGHLDVTFLGVDFKVPVDYDEQLSLGVKWE